ncbi:MAG: adenylyltransferase, partial [Actinomycetota bacterium]|nr:adenylyltransferase [Actinomycetota bacterium]
MEYIRSGTGDVEPEGCVFCGIRDGREAEHVLVRTDLGLVVLNKFPYNPGHLVILPTRHVGDIEDLTTEENAELQSLLQRSVRALREESEPQGFNIGMNLGRVGGAGIPDHVHWHVVPRWGGDTNFMPVIG